MLDTLFIYVVNMSVAASVVFFIVMLIRLIFKNKLPKIFSYVLWLLVLLRLLIPISFSTPLSIFNYINAPTKVLHFNEDIGGIEYISEDIGMMAQPKIETGFPMVNKKINEKLPAAAPESSVNPMQIIMFIASFIWVCGVGGMLLFLTVLYIITINRLKTATLYQNDETLRVCAKKIGLRKKIKIYLSDRINTPIVCGLINPRIVLPVDCRDREDLRYIILHELIHIKRRDYLIKPLSLLVLAIHWFNPTVWVSYILAHKDMELSCDERVIATFEKDVRKEYAYSLLNMSISQSNLFNGGLLAFGEKNIKVRIKNIVNYKKRTFLVTLIGIVVLVVVSVSLLGNPQADSIDLNYLNKDNALDLLAQTDPLFVNGKYIISPNVELMKLFQDNKWQELKVRSPLELSSELWFDVNETLAIKFYDGDSLAMITSHGGYRYYKIPEDIYSNLREYVFTNKRDAFMEGPVDTIEVTKANQIEEYLQIIMSSPQESSSPQDYIRDHKDEYGKIEKMGDEALEYLLSCFEQGKAEGLKGHIMMELCIDILGNRNNVQKHEYTTPQEWYAKLKIYEVTPLPKAVLPQGNTLKDMATAAALTQYDTRESELTIVAPHIFGSYENDGELTIYTTVYYQRYVLYGKTLLEEGAGIVPAAIKYQKNNEGSYKFKEYIEAMDGGYFKKSIEEFCRPNEDMARVIMEHYGNYSDLFDIMRENLITYLKSNNLTGLSLKKDNGEIIPLTW